ncbi:DUF1345 domain-containing protein [Cellulomonas triticagri]|uniref:DUF1345 domain-containing protein n=1 Tax=Cellulomonas triticagri TaxID=2483352 RepID=A0A3M2IQ67_9CELL|nr:DUF1345 domain-containing protein [Cellulomonas triticagri]RMI02076.1 DUF1345 domain-containing protein [Cellulomonas triticagri]
MAGRYVSDTARANWSSLAAGVLGVGGALALTDWGQGLEPEDLTSFTVPYFLVTWPVFVLIYLAWTHVAYARRGPRALESSTRRERTLSRRWWNWLLGYGGAANWTLLAALAAVLVTVAVAQDPGYREDWRYIVLGLICVASSWAAMVYAFALQYLRLDAGVAEEQRAVRMEAEGDPRFDDYLTLAVLLSTMAATVSARVRTREGWGLVRLNVLFAFAFNSVIVAMMVSLLFGGLGG